MTDLVQRTIDGLLLAGPYALAGLGLTLGFGMLRRLNLAYGAGAMLGAYVGAWLHLRHGVPVWAVVAAVVAVSAVAGLYVEALCFAGRGDGAADAARPAGPVGGADGREVVALAASFALWMQIEELAVGLMPRHLVPFPAFPPTGEWSVGPWAVRPDRLAMLVVAVAIVGAVSALLHRTRAGLAWRAAADRPVAGHLAGLAVPRVQRVAFVATCGLGGLAACAALALEGQATPMFGMWMLVKGLVAAMLGRLGSVRGVLAGAVALGVVEAHAQAAFGALGRDAAAWTLLLAVLAWRGGLLRRGPGTETVHA